MKSWLKGGLTGVGVWIISIILIGFLPPLFPMGIFATNRGLLLMYPCLSLFEGEGGIICLGVGPFMNLILAFLIGTLISWIIGKIKNKNK